VDAQQASRRGTDAEGYGALTLRCGGLTLGCGALTLRVRALTQQVRRYNSPMAGRECYHCKQWIGDGEPHDCWTTTEAALTQDLSEDLQEAYARLRETAVEFGEQRIYASHSSIMFARKACYFFVRPKKSFLEVCIFLPRAIRAPQVHKAVSASTVKTANMVRIRHRDEVEPPVTDWLREAYALPDNQPKSKRTPTPKPRHKTKAGATTKAQARKKKKKTVSSRRR
jgi:hypothetical protein